MKTSLPIKITRKSQSSAGIFGVDLVAMLIQTLVYLFSVRLSVSFFRHLTGYSIRAIDILHGLHYTDAFSYFKFSFCLFPFVLLCTEQDKVARAASGCLPMSLLLSAVKRRAMSTPS